MFPHIKFSYSKEYLKRKETPPIQIKERPKLDYEKAASELREDTSKIENEIQEIKNLISKENSDFSFEYERLEKEQSEICEMKYEEIDNTTAKIKTLKSSIIEIEDWFNKKLENDEKIELLKVNLGELETKNTQFVEFIESLTRVVSSIKNPGSNATDELFHPSPIISRTKGDLPSSSLSNSLFTLRQIIIRLYAQTCTGNCPIQ